MAAVGTRFKILKSIILASAVLMGISAPVHSEAPGNVMIVIGTAAVNRGDVSSAKERAIENALVTAVQLATEDYLPTELMVREFQQLDETIYRHTDRFVQDYRVLTENASDKDYRVMVEARISGKEVEKSLAAAGIIHSRKALPAALVLVSEKRMDDAAASADTGIDLSGAPTAESALIQALKERGFSIIDASGSLYLASRAHNDAMMSREEAVKAGARLQADVVIVGRAVASSGPNTISGEINSYRGMIEARAISTRTGEDMATVNKTVVAAAANPVEGCRQALSEVGKEAGTDLASRLSEAWVRESQKPGRMEIVVRGTGNLANFVMFRRALNDTSGIEGIQVSEIQPDQATLEVKFQGKARELADRLILKSFNSFRIDISEVTAKHMTVSLIPIS